MRQERTRSSPGEPDELRRVNQELPGLGWCPWTPMDTLLSNRHLFGTAAQADLDEI